MPFLRLLFFAILYFLKKTSHEGARSGHSFQASPQASGYRDFGNREATETEVRCLESGREWTAPWPRGI